MANYIVAVPLDPSLADYIGKRGSESSMSFYNRKVGQDTIVGLAPTSIGDKFYAAAEAILLSDMVVLSTAALDRLFGEMLLACAVAGRRVIFDDLNDAARMIDGAGISGHKVVRREDVLGQIVAMGPRANPDGGRVRIDLDRCFPVKGVGTIALGIVTRGTVKVHDELLHGSGKKVTIRSIQSQDVDVQSAVQGTRVGLSIKGMEHDEVEKGDALSNVAVPRKAEVRVRVVQGRFGAEQLLAGNYYDIVSNFSVSNAQVLSVDGDVATLKLAKQLALSAGDEFLLLRERQPRIFAGGKVVG